MEILHSMSNEAECLVSEAFMDSKASETEVEKRQETVMIMEDLDLCSKSPQQSTLQTTLGIASFAANQVRASIAQSWTRSSLEQVDTALFGEDLRISASSTIDSSSDDDKKVMELPPLKDVAIEGNDYGGHESGVVSQLLFLPVRLVHSSVSTAVAIPTRVATYSGRKISEAASASHAMATSAVVASSDVVARTGMHVVRGITHGAVSTASFTASTISGAVGASVRTVSYVIPPSVSNAVWQGIDVSGNASVNVLSHAIAVPSYRMLQALVPAVKNWFSEDDMVNETRTTIKMLVKLLGPQNAFYVVKWIYETVNSEEAYDAFLLCRDILHESLDAENYWHAGTSVGATTGFSKVVHVVKEAYSVLPSLDELLDAAVLVADVSDEVVDGVAHAVTKESDLNDRSEPRFAYVEDDDEPWAHGPVEITDATFERQRSSSSSEEELNPLFESGLLLLTRACDSEEASSLFNTFGDFLDVLVD